MYGTLVATHRTSEIQTKKILLAPLASFFCTPTLKMVVRRALDSDIIS